MRRNIWGLFPWGLLIRSRGYQDSDGGTVTITQTRATVRRIDAAIFAFSREGARGYSITFVKEARDGDVPMSVMSDMSNAFGLY